LIVFLQFMVKTILTYSAGACLEIGSESQNRFEGVYIKPPYSFIQYEWIYYL